MKQIRIHLRNKNYLSQIFFSESQNLARTTGVLKREEEEKKNREIDKVFFKN